MGFRGYLERNRLRLALLLMVSFLILGFSLLLIPQLMIDGFERQLASDLTVEETWRYEGALQWWKSASVTLFSPLAGFLIALNGGLLAFEGWNKLTTQERDTKVAGLSAQEAELEELRSKVWSYRKMPTRLAGYAVTIIGAAILGGSMIFSSTVWAMVGLPLVFWGILLFFLKPTSLVRADLLDSSSYSLHENIERLISEFGLRGKGIYLPPQHLEDMKSGLVYIPKKDEIYVPTSKEIKEAENRIFLKNPDGVFLVPSGVALTNLYEKELGTNFAKVDLEYLMRNLPKVFVEALEIAEDFELHIEGDTVHVCVIGLIYDDFLDGSRKHSDVCGSYGCPLCSSIACALARTSGKPVVIDEQVQRGNVMDMNYRLLEA